MAQSGARWRLLPRLCGINPPAFAISGNCIGRPADRQMARRVALPILTLATNLGDFDTAVTLDKRANATPASIA